MEYNLRIGQLISVWTPHVSHGDTGPFSMTSASLFISIFPEQDRSCNLLVEDHSDNGSQCKTPVGYRKSQQLLGLMTMKNFIDGGYDVKDGKLVVCVKSIGPKKTGRKLMCILFAQIADTRLSSVTSKKGTTSSLVNVVVFDDTAEATLTLWNAAAASAAIWKPSSTILLISNPGWRIETRTWLSLNASTHIEVNPKMADADWLRSFAQRLTRRQSTNQPFPSSTQHLTHIVNRVH